MLLLLLGGLAEWAESQAQVLTADTLCLEPVAISADQAVALAMLRAKGTPQPYAGPHARLVRLQGRCAWNVQLDTYRHTNRGECRRTNGCTLVKITVLWFDVETGHLIRRKKSKRLYPNYE
jgi:hypothetical protein